MKVKVSTLIVIVMVAVVVAAVIVFRLYVGIPAQFQLSDPSNDVELSMGTQYPGIVDVVNAALGANGTTLNVTIIVQESFYSLGDGEIAQWNVTMILENETDVLKTYEISVDMNSTHLAGSIVDVETQNVRGCQVSTQANSLVVLAVVDELSNARMIEWRILAIYERYIGGELTTSASDLAPDEGLQKTALEP